MLVPVFRLAAIVLQLIYVRIYTQRLSNAQLGDYFFLLTASYSLNAFIFVPMDYFQQARIYPFRADGISLRSLLIFNRKLIAGILLAAALATSLTAACAHIFELRQQLIGIIERDIVLGTLMAAALYSSGSLKSLLNNLEHKNVAAAAFLLEALAKIGVFLAVIHVVQSGPAALLGSNILVLFVETALLLLVCGRLNIFGPGRIVPIETREVVRFSLPMAGSAVANWLQLQGYRLVLVPLGFGEAVGIYAAVSNIGLTGMNAVSVIFSQLFTPNIYKSHGAYAGRYLRNAAILSAAVLLGGALLSAPLVKILTRRDLAPYHNLVAYGILTEVGNFLIGGIAIALTIKGTTKPVLQSTLFGLAVVALTFGLLQIFGAVNAVTIGLPIALSQALIVLTLFPQWKRSRNAADEGDPRLNLIS